jgi:hypothetical protein
MHFSRSGPFEIAILLFILAYTASARSIEPLTVSRRRLERRRSLPSAVLVVLIMISLFVAVVGIFSLPPIISSSSC